MIDQPVTHDLSDCIYSSKRLLPHSLWYGVMPQCHQLVSEISADQRELELKASPHGYGIAVDCIVKLPVDSGNSVVCPCERCVTTRRDLRDRQRLDDLNSRLTRLEAIIESKSRE